MAIFRVALAVAACAALAGCAGGEKVKAVPQFERIECKRYSRDEQALVAAELRKYAAEVPTLADFNDDYGSLRAAVCKHLKKYG